MTPLHLAVKLEEASSRNILIEYMSKIDYIQINTFGRILKDLLEADNFLKLFDA
jgi:hypothetical protein